MKSRPEFKLFLLTHCSNTVDGGNWKGDGSGSVYEIPKSLNLTQIIRTKIIFPELQRHEGNRRTFTWSGWVKRSLSGGLYQAIFTSNTEVISRVCGLAAPKNYVSLPENSGTTHKFIPVNSELC